MKRKPILGLVLSSLVVLTGCGRKSEQGQGPPPAFPVQSAAAIQQRIEPKAIYTGRFVAVEEVELRARVSGYLESVHFTEGQKIKEGDLMFQIDPRPFDALVEAADARVKQAEARATLAKVNADRVARLVKDGAVSKEEADTRKSEFAIAEADVLAAKAELKSAKLDREFADVRAPISGIANDFEVTPGNYITGGSLATVLTTIVPHSPIHCVFELDERRILEFTRMYFEGKTKGRSGERPTVEVSVADSDEFEFSGIMDFTENQLDPNTATSQARVLIENKNEFLTPGLFAKVRAPLGAPYDAILVRDSALGFDLSKRFAWVVKKGENGPVTERRYLEVGALEREFRIVESGLEPGEEIVVSGIQLLRDGMPIAPTVVPMDPNAEADEPAKPKAAEAEAK